MFLKLSILTKYSHQQYGYILGTSVFNFQDKERYYVLGCILYDVKHLSLQMGTGYALFQNRPLFRYAKSINRLDNNKSLDLKL